MESKLEDKGGTATLGWLKTESDPPDGIPWDCGGQLQSKCLIGLTLVSSPPASKCTTYEGLEYSDLEAYTIIGRAGAVKSK